MQMMFSPIFKFIKREGRLKTGYHKKCDTSKTKMTSVSSRRSKSNWLTLLIVIEWGERVALTVAKIRGKVYGKA